MTDSARGGACRLNDGGSIAPRPVHQSFGRLALVSRPAARPIGVLFIGVLPFWDDRGSSIHMREVVLALADRGIRPVVVCLPGRETRDGARLVEIGIGANRRRFLFQLLWNLKATMAAVGAVRAQHLDLIYSRLDPGIVVGWLTSLATRLPLVVEMNGLPTADLVLYRPNNWILRRVTRLWEAMMYRAASAIVAAPGYARYASEHFGVAPEKFCVAPLGVNLDLFFPRDRKACCLDVALPLDPTICWIGTAAPWQGLQTLIAAAPRVVERIPTARFVIVGNGPTLDDCRRAVQARGVGDRFTFTGQVPYSRVPYYIGASTVCVATLPGNRGARGSISALKTVSYLASGRPVVTSRMDEMADRIESNGAGFAVTPDDPEQLAERLVTVLGEDEEPWRQRSERARGLVTDEQSWGASADRIATRLKELVS